MKKNSTYLNIIPYIEEIITSLKVENATQEERDRLHDVIFDRLTIRVMETLFEQLGPREFKLIEKLTQDHPEIDKFDAVMIVAREIKGLDKKLAETIETTTLEMVAEAQAVDEFMKKQEAKKER